jgi:hypothetical protein
LGRSNYGADSLAQLMRLECGIWRAHSMRYIMMILVGIALIFFGVLGGLCNLITAPFS